MRYPSIQRALAQRAALLIVAAAFAAPAHAEPDPCDEPIVGCGKAQWAACHPLGDRPEDAPSLREALTDTDVQHVKLDFEVSNITPASNTCTINGTGVMTIKSKSAALTEFTFRLRTNYTITSLTVTDGANPPVAVTSSTIGNRTRVVTLNRPYGMNEVFDLTIAYNGNSTSVGFGSIDVGTHGASNPVVATLSEPYYAYSWWPAKDGDVGLQGDNSDKSTFEMAVTVPDTYVVASNGLLQGVDTLTMPSRRKFRWATNYPMVTYLASFAATNYTTWTKTYNYPAGDTYPAGSMPVEFYIYPGNDSPSNRAAWEKCTDMMATFRPIYGEYPFIQEKYGIYNFNFGGGMEHQTMTGQTSFGESLTAHELAHQWWGDNVTCETWGDIWLNEGFATYSECLWEERKSGGINTTAYFNAINGRRPTNNGGDGSVYRYDVSSAGTIFSSTYAYNKGAWVLHMLRRAVGSDAAFFNILAAHRAAHEGSAATTLDFATIASGVSGQNLMPFFNQWVYHRGAPTYQYGWQTSNVLGQDYLLLRIAQTQAATVGTDPAPPPPFPTTPHVLNVYTMPVDLQCTIGGSPQTITVNNDARAEWFVVPVSGPVTALTFDNNHLDATSPRAFILRGAASLAAYSPGPPKIVKTSPPLGASIPQVSSPTQLAVTFHTPVNASNAHFTLVGDTTGPQVMSLVSGSNVNPAVLNLAGPLPPDTYTLTVTTGVTAVNSGMALDGEVANPTSTASLPSGNGVAGGNAVMQFTVVPCDIAADIDQDCDRDDTDVMLFVDVLLESNLTPLYMTRSDLSGNTIADSEDIQFFVDAFSAP